MGQITSKPMNLSCKTREQKEIIEEYFFPTNGCLKKTMDNAEYFNRVKRKYESYKIKEKALNKLGIDESQVTEIPPVEFVGFSFDGNYMLKNGRTSKYESTWLFFSDEQIFVYSFCFDMTSDATKERTEEYFYKDVTSFSSATESIEVVFNSVPGSGCGSTGPTKGSIDRSYFSIIVPGDKFSCSMQKTATIEDRIQGMKQKLREKKNK